MNSNVAIPRNVIIYGLCIPLAVLMGYLLTTPLDLLSVLGVGVVMGGLLVPVLLKWHHVFLITTWNATINAFFLPGQPRFWMALCVASIVFSILNRIMDKQNRLQNVSWITMPLVALTLVLLVTAQLRGGIGLTSLGGGSFGGRKYFEALIAILGYFALSWQKIPPHRAALYAALFFLSGLTNAISNLAYATESYWLFWLFPVDTAVLQIQADYAVHDRAFMRLSGVAFACMAPFCYLLSRYGVRGTLDLSSNWSLLPLRFRGGLGVNQPWRLLVLLAAVAASTFGGFRSMPILFGMIFMIQFCLEGLYKTRLMFGLLGLILMGSLIVIPFSNQMPLTVQRAISFLPVKLNSSVQYDAWASTDWRVRMWNVVVDEIPKYLWLGKGYSGSASDLFMIRESRRRGFISDFEGSYIAGDYHSGPLSVIVPLGVWGAAAFLWFLGASFFALYRNYRHGPPAYRLINLFLLAFFIGHLVFYMLAYGAFTTGLFVFTGIIGFSISLNGGVHRRVAGPSLSYSQSSPRTEELPAGASAVTSEATIQQPVG